MKKAIILHGINKSKESAAEYLLPVTTWHWLGWLQQKYNLADVNCQNVLFPHSWYPDKTFEDDYEVFKSFKIDEDTRLIGWSAGTTFLFKYLSKHPEIKARHLVLLAPYLNTTKLLPEGYFDFETEFDPKIFGRFNRVDLFYSTDDPIPGILESAEKLIEMFPNIIVHKFENHGHFKEQEMGTKEFPELWEVCKKEI
ncbi:MAG: alpha/beta hydrolase [Alphaproteobacteria bacterium]|nr:alpha/beta hydrolase [Alphaproteobacteria bacterium]